MKKERRYIVKKYVMASSVEDALKKEPDCSVDAVWVDDDWLKQEAVNEVSGFRSKGK